MNVADRIIRQKVQLNEEHPFFAYLVLNLNERQVKAKDMPVPTAGVNFKGEMFYVPEWMDSLTDGQIKFVLCHEISHLSFGHLFRVGNRQPEIWNIACDSIVNNMLIKNGMESLTNPPNGEYITPKDNEVKLFGGKICVKDLDKKFVEQVYDELYKQLKDNNMIKQIIVCKYGMPGKGKGQPMKGDSGCPQTFDSHGHANKNGTDKEKRELNKIEDKWGEKLVEAIQHSKQRGKIPAGMQRIVDKILNKKLNWRSLLYKYITNSLPYDITWQKPSKKSFSIGIYLPGTLKENIEVVYAIDTSGSISEDELNSFVGEMISLGKSFANIEITVLFCDAKIHNTYVVSNGNIPKILNEKIGGRGGTSHREIVDFINKEKPNARVLVSLSDGYSDIKETFKDLPNGCDSIICLTENGCDPKDLEGCGKIVKMED